MNENNIEKHLEKLEFNKIINTVSTFCKTFIGKQFAFNLKPSNIKANVIERLSETKESVNLIYRTSSPTFYEIADISKHLKILENYGILSLKALLDLGNIFKQSGLLKDYFNKDFLNNDQYPILTPLFQLLYSNIGINNKIYSSIIDENTLDDKASSNLYSLRRKQRKIEIDIKEKLNKMIHGITYSKYIQENIVTIRNDRFVIPVKEEFRGKVKGFIHDISNAGATVFIEPTSIFELNNELNNLKIEEEIEIEKILKELTKLFYPYINELKNDIDIIGKLDFIFAKAKYSNTIKGITPIINDKKEINLINARHPLIPSDIVVPISINLGSVFSILVITGPNTGGKTVSLKTVGLLEYMACSGLNIPADEHSSIFVFDKIFADIGDNQSIIDSLSTFSSHMLNIVDIINNSTQNSLVLVDELGSGTDPLEGANLAISILESLEKIGALVISTTHYQELKKYALKTNNFENASVEFNIKTLSPTYRLLVGFPGKSNAFEISEKLGLKTSIIARAKSLMSNDDINIEELLKNIHDNKLQSENDKIKIEKKLQSISLLKENLEKDNSNLYDKEKDIINNAKIKARNLLLTTKEEIDDIIKEANTLKDSNKDLNNLRNKLNTNINNIHLNNNNNLKTNNILLDKKNIKPNTEVFVNNLNQNGIVISNISKNNEVQVQIGAIKMCVNINTLSPFKKVSTENSNNAKNIKKNNTKNNSYNQTYSKLSKSMHATTEINIIGLNVDEAIPIVDKFLDDCALSKLPSVRIVHGKGTGKLRTGIHNYLRNHPHVENFRTGTFGEGEMGVTIVIIK